MGTTVKGSEDMRLFSGLKKKPEDNFEQKLRDLREQEIQNYEANLPKEEDKPISNQNQDA